MKVVYLPQNGTNFINYEIVKNNIDFNNGELIFNISKKERDYDVVVDICKDYTGSLVMGATEGQSYVAQLFIPAREYIEKEVENIDLSVGFLDEGTASMTNLSQEPVPFNINKCELRLWELEV